MSYLFADIFGQDEAIAHIQRAWSAGKMPHAMLFVGPNGVGRRTTAMALAQALLCNQPVTLAGRPPATGPRAAMPDFPAIRQACGRCHDCRMVDAGTHPDLHLIYRELARYHDDPAVRDRKMQDLGIGVIGQFLLQQAYLSSSRGRGKVFIVLEADLMSTEAQQALLKTLEEPPAGVTIILVAESAQQMLPTTISRCAVIHFHRLGTALVQQKLVERGVDAPQASFWAIFTEGSLGSAMELSQGGLYPLKRELVTRLAELPAWGDVAWGEQLHEHCRKLADQTLREAKKDRGVELAQTVATREAAVTVLALLASAVRDALALASGSDQPQANADQRDQVAKLAGRLSPGQLAEVLEQLATYEQLLWRNVNLKLLWDNVAITCGNAAPLPLGQWA